MHFTCFTQGAVYISFDSYKAQTSNQNVENENTQRKYAKKYIKTFTKMFLVASSTE